MLNLEMMHLYPSDIKYALIRELAGDSIMKARLSKDMHFVVT